MDQSVRRRLRLTRGKILVLAWVIALTLALWIVGRLPLSQLQQDLGELLPAQWLIWIGLNVLIVGLLGGRWWVLTRAMHLETGFLQLLRVRQAGFLFSFVTPGPQFGGEPLQVYWLWKKYGVAGPDAFLAVGLDRFYEFWINFAVLLVAVLALLASQSTPGVDWLPVATVLVAMMLLMALSAWTLLRQPASLRGFFRRIASPWLQHARLAQLSSHWSQISESLQQLVEGQRSPLGNALLLSVLAWVGMILEFWFLLCIVAAPTDLASFLFLFAAMRLAFLLPLPGGVGSLEAAMFWSFQTLGAPLEQAAALILLMRLRDVLVLLSGVLVLPGLHSEPGD